MKRTEIIDYLIRKNIEVTEDNISKVEVDGFGAYTLETILDVNSAITHGTLDDIYSYVVESMCENVEKRIALEEDLDVLRSKIENRFDLLQRNIGNAIEEIRIAQVLEGNMAGEIKTVSIDFDSTSIINPESTALVSDGVVVGGSSHGEFVDKNAIRLKEYSIENISASMSRFGIVSPVLLQIFNTNGIATIAKADDGIVNSGKRFNLSGMHELPGMKIMDVVIDRLDKEYFNQIEVKLFKAHMCMVYTSKDGILYDRQLSKPKYVKNTIIPISGTSDRYVKISFTKMKHDRVAGGKYAYALLIDELNILKSTLSESTSIETVDIEVPGNYTAVSLDTCCNYANPGVNIDYYVSIDGQDYTPIRPVAKAKSDKMNIPTALPINNYVDNKMIHITKFEDKDGGYVTELDIPGEFLSANTVRVFSSYVKRGEEWNSSNGYHAVTGVLSESKTIQLGDTQMMINGSWATGEVYLPKGVYSIRTTDDYFLNIIQSNTVEILSEINGEYTVVDSDGIHRTFMDPLYPYNHKIIAEEIFDALLGRELIENVDYSLYNNGTTYNINTPVRHEDILVIYRLHSKNLTTFKLRCDMQSIDKTTVPYIEKALIKLA